MTTAAIDLDLLNELFDNQKKLDDVFNSMFDDEAFLNASASDRHNTKNNAHTTQLDHDFLPSTQYNADTSKSNHITRIILTIALEVTVISYCIMYFN